jgi:hypothetical protein
MAMVEIKTEELEDLLCEVLKGFRIISVTPYKLQTLFPETLAFPSPLQNWVVTSFLVVYESMVE